MTDRERPLKTPDESRTENTFKLRYDAMNGENRLFGGRLMSFIDEVGAIAAERHSRQKVATVSVDNLVFSRAAYLNDLLVLTAKVTYVGTTSLEVCVRSYVEDIDGRRELINRAYLTYVTLDDEGLNPAMVRYGLKLTSEEEKAEWEEAAVRRERKRRDRGILR